MSMSLRTNISLGTSLLYVACREAGVGEPTHVEFMYTTYITWQQARKLVEWCEGEESFEMRLLGMCVDQHITEYWYDLADKKNICIQSLGDKADAVMDLLCDDFKVTWG